MMTSLAQNFQPGGIQQHPGVPPGHPMAVPHNPNQQMQGPGMPQQMHMGVSGPGPQVSQPGAMMGGLPPGVGGPSAHALQHLNPQQQQLFQQQQMFANNPQLQQMQQQQIMIQQQRAQQARQAMLQQQYSGMQQGIPNGMAQMNPAQFNAMRGAGPMGRPVNVNLPQHLQQQQQQAQQAAQHNMEQAQAQAQHQQLMQAQQMALQQQQANAQAQAQAGPNNHPPPTPMNAQQLQSMQQAQMAAAQQAHQQQNAAAHQQNQAQNAAQQPAPNQPNPQAQAPQAQSQAQAQVANIQQQQQQQAVAMLQQQQRQQQQQQPVDLAKGQCLLQLMLFADHLSGFGGTKQRDDLNYWNAFVQQFFSPKGVLRHSVWIVEENSNKQYEITFPALARYFHTHFESGVTNMQLIMERCAEKALPNNQHFIESAKSSFVYWFDNGSQLIASGSLKAHFDNGQKIELLEFITNSHEEYLPRNRLIEAARPVHEWNKHWNLVNSTDGKGSPEMNKKKQKQMKSPPQAPPEIDIPHSKVKQSMGITHSVFRFLEFVEVLGQMNPLFAYSHQNSNLAPYGALDQYVSTIVANANVNPNASPAPGNLNLPGSPHISGSPAQAPGMLPQHSQQGTHSSGPSANTSPNVANNKRRRPSAVKLEDDNSQVNGAGQTGKANSVKASPRVGGKRQKGNAS